MEWLFVVVPILLIVLVAGGIVRALVLDYRERREGEISLPEWLEGAGPSMDIRHKVEQRSRITSIAA